MISSIFTILRINSQLVKKNSFQAIHLAVLLVLIYLVVFVKIDTYHIRWWDESLFAVNTHDMLSNHKYFSLYFDGIHDYTNTKPPLTIWLQLIFVKLLGYNEMAVRLPSAIAAAISVIVLFLFVDKRFGKVYAWLSTLVFLTSLGYFGFHTARTADADSLLSLFVLLTNINFLRFVNEQRRVLILYFFIFITLAFCTKMYAALLFAPAYLFILVRHKLFKGFIGNSFFWIGLVFFVGAAFTLIYLRELDTPGYIHEILFKDAGRVFNVVEDHNATWEYYLDNLILTRFSFWFIVLLIGSVFIVSNWRNPNERIFQDLFVMVLAYLVVISLSVTKLEWYDMPLYPLMAMICAYGLYKALETKINLQTANRVSIVVLFVIFAYPYWLMFRKSQANTMPNGDKIVEGNERFLFIRSVGPSDLNGLKVYFDGWNGSLLFYKYKFADKGEKIDLVQAPDFSVNDRVLLCSDSLFEVVKSKYRFTLLAKEGSARLLKID